MITATQKEIAQAIRNNIYEDFALRHLSGNLMNTIEIIHNEEDARVRVPAIRYDLKEWNRSETIIYTPQEGSYANAVDIHGGFSRTHQNYADRAIIKAVREVCAFGDLAYDIEVY